jgi:hypothetical protein
MTDLQLWDKTGAFCPIADSDLANLSDVERVLYLDVKAASEKCAAVETELSDTTKELHATVAEMRALESRVSKLPRPTHLDLVRQMVADG